MDTRRLCRRDRHTYIHLPFGGKGSFFVSTRGPESKGVVVQVQVGVCSSERRRLERNYLYTRAVSSRVARTLRSFSLRLHSLFGHFLSAFFFFAPFRASCASIHSFLAQISYIARFSSKSVLFYDRDNVVAIYIYARIIIVSSPNCRVLDRLCYPRRTRLEGVIKQRYVWLRFVSLRERNQGPGQMENVEDLWNVG